MTTERTTVQIDPRILKAFGLDEEVLQRIEAEGEKETRNVIAGLIARTATAIYGRMKTGIATEAQLTLFNPQEADEFLATRGITPKNLTGDKVSIGRIEKPEDLPDALAEAVNTDPAAPNSSLKENMDTFLIHFGHDALDAGDWKTAVNAYDIATMDQTNGLLNSSNDWLIRKLREPFEEEPKQLLVIARYLQARFDRRLAQTQPH